MHWHLQQASQAILNGGVIACPTEAVWGLSCDPLNPDAVQRLLSLKQRPMHKGLIMVAASLAQIEPWLQSLNSQQRETLNASWPGPHTWLIPPIESIPTWITGEHEKVAVRVTNHPQLNKLCQLTGPLLSTSANPAGKSPALNALKIRQYFGDQLDFILPGTVGAQNNPSSITDLISGQRFR